MLRSKSLAIHFNLYVIVSQPPSSSKVATYASGFLLLQFTEAGGSSLPSWLHFDKSAGVLQGVPADEDAGHHYILIVATGDNGDEAKDVFDIQVCEHVLHIPELQ